MVRNTADNTYGPPTYIVSPDISKGTHTTIQSAIDDAVAGDYIFVKAGTYVENITLEKGIRIQGEPGSAEISGSLLQGKITQSVGTTACLTDMRFVTNGDVIYDVSGVGTNQTGFTNCSFFLTDDDCMTINSATANPVFRNCSFLQTANTLDYFNVTAVGDLGFQNCRFFNASLTPGTSTVAAGRVVMQNCFHQRQLFTTSGTGLYLWFYCHFNGNGNFTYLTTAGTGISELIYVYMNAGTSTAISIGAGTTVNARFLAIDTTSGTPIAATGTLNTTYNQY